jgi:hypothetical protein
MLFRVVQERNHKAFPDAFRGHRFLKTLYP